MSAYYDFEYREGCLIDVDCTVTDEGSVILMVMDETRRAVLSINIPRELVPVFIIELSDAFLPVLVELQKEAMEEMAGLMGGLTDEEE